MISAKALRRRDGPGPTLMGDCREKGKAPVLPVSRETTKQTETTHTVQVRHVVKLLKHKGESAAKEIESRIQDGRVVIAKGIRFGPEILEEALQAWKAEQKHTDAPIFKAAPTAAPTGEGSRSVDSAAVCGSKAVTGAVPWEDSHVGADAPQRQQVKRRLSKAVSDEGVEQHVDAQPKKMPRTSAPESLPRPKPMPHKSPSLRERLSVRTGCSSLDGVDLLDGELPKTAPVRRALSPASTATPCRGGAMPTNMETVASTHKRAALASPPRSPTSEFTVWSSQDRGYQIPARENKPSRAPQAYGVASGTSSMPSKIGIPPPPQVSNPSYFDEHRLQQSAADGQVPSSGAAARSIKELKTLLSDAGVDIAGCVEKAELSALWQQLESIRARPIEELQASCSAAGGPRFGTVDECANFLMSTTRQSSNQKANVTAPRQPMPTLSTQQTGQNQPAPQAHPAAARAAPAASAASATAAGTTCLESRAPTTAAGARTGSFGFDSVPQLSSESGMDTLYKVPPLNRTTNSTDCQRQAECTVRELDASREAARILRLKREHFRTAVAWGFNVLDVTMRDVASVQRNYRTLMRKLHPDKAGSDPNMVRAGEIIREAKDVCERSLSKKEAPNAPRNLRSVPLCTIPGKRKFRLHWTTPESREVAPVRRYVVAAVDPAYGRALTIAVLEPDYNEELRRFVSVDELASHELAEEELQKMPSLWKQATATVQVAAANEAGQSSWAIHKVCLNGGGASSFAAAASLMRPSANCFANSCNSTAFSDETAAGFDAGDTQDEYLFNLELRRRRGPDLRLWLMAQRKGMLVAWLKSVRWPTTGTKEELVGRVINAMDGAFA